MSPDWSTLAFQTVNIAVLVWLLGRVFWRPVSQAIARRRADTDSILQKAEQARDEAENLRARLAAEHEAIAAERQAALAAAHAAGEAERAALIAAAHDEVNRLEAAAQARIAVERAAVHTALTARAADLAAEMAARLGREMDGPALRAACLEDLAARIGTLPEADRRSLAANGGLTVGTPAPLPPDEEAAARDRIAKAVGGAPSLIFRPDPSLVVGIELAGPHLTVSNCWRDGLARMRKEIDRDG